MVPSIFRQKIALYQYGEDPKNRMPYQPQPTSVNVTVNVSRETPAEAPAEEEKTEKAE